mmetsp:Transcript_125178/g.339961  ORF Transcript_125178/g.339961 Transcript_125178/m.339961 type:complete len:211 (-) Transcript_125178:870-1502(-)
MAYGGSPSDGSVHARRLSRTCGTAGPRVPPRRAPNFVQGGLEAFRRRRRRRRRRWRRKRAAAQAPPSIRVGLLGGEVRGVPRPEVAAQPLAAICWSRAPFGGLFDSFVTLGPASAAGCLGACRSSACRGESTRNCPPRSCCRPIMLCPGACAAWSSPSSARVAGDRDAIVSSSKSASQPLPSSRYAVQGGSSPSQVRKLARSRAPRTCGT